MFANVDSDSDILCIIQGVISICCDAQCTLFVDTRFVCDGSILYFTDIDGCNDVLATAFAVVKTGVQHIK